MLNLGELSWWFSTPILHALFGLMFTLGGSGLYVGFPFHGPRMDLSQWKCSLSSLYGLNMTTYFCLWGGGGGLRNSFVTLC
jgi:hypothetical protein